MGVKSIGAQNNVKGSELGLEGVTLVNPATSAEGAGAVFSSIKH